MLPVHKLTHFLISLFNAYRPQFLHFNLIKTYFGLFTRDVVDKFRGVFTPH